MTWYILIPFDPFAYGDATCIISTYAPRLTYTCSAGAASTASGDLWPRSWPQHAFSLGRVVSSQSSERLRCRFLLLQYELVSGEVSAGSAGTDLATKCSIVPPLRLFVYGPRGVRKPHLFLKGVLTPMIWLKAPKPAHKDSCIRQHRRAPAVQNLRVSTSSSSSSASRSSTTTYTTSGLRAQRPNRAHLGEHVPNLISAF